LIKDFYCPASLKDKTVTIQYILVFSLFSDFSFIGSGFSMMNIVLNITIITIIIDFLYQFGDFKKAQL
jgi:hypothetical protein